ncbi:MAG TPA: amidohydrolase family protein [Mycobacteriales bacterium]|nr:amidohydrolase family protein [Mycobacteriales bacterium]
MQRTLLANARVLTCSGDPAERPTDGDILIEGDRIAAVSRGRMALDSTSIRIVDLAGATVLPALCDAHTHISWPLDFVFDHDAVAAEEPGKHALEVAAVARTFVESGYTMVIGAGATQPQDDLLAKASIERGLMPGPRIIPSGPMVTEVGALGADGAMMDVVSGPREIREVVARQCDAGVRAVKLFISGDGIVAEYPSEDVYMNDAMLEAAVDEAAKHGAFITTHARSAPSVAMAARTGVRIIHHACFLDDTAMKELQARGTDVWVCPGLHYLYAMVSGAAAPYGMTEERIERSGYRQEFHSLIDNIAALHAAGVLLLAGGDFGHQWTHHGTYAAELARYVELCGLSPVEALHTATRNVGPVVGLDWGEIRPGALADLVVIDGDPTEDITLLARPERRRAVIKAGGFAYVNPELYP